MILSLDPGLATFGWAVVQSHTGRVIDCGVLLSKPKPKLTKAADRVRRATDQALLLRGVARRHGVELVVAETMSFAPRSSAAAKIGIGLSWGVAVGVAAMLEVELRDLPPKTWQRAIVPAAAGESDAAAIDYERVFAELGRYVDARAFGIDTLSDANRTHVLDAIGIGVFAAVWPHLTGAQPARRRA